jgi:predicted O-methyltransferase YrrM
MTEKNERIKELLLTPRMFYADYNNRVNQLKGLKMLIDEYINEHTIMVEIGSFSGVSSELFSLHCKEIHCVDLWDAYWEIEDKQKTEFAEYTFNKLLVNYNNIKKIKDSSTNAANMFQDKSLDFVYIDAAHDYENVKKDILAWLPKVKDGGYIAGHDYRYDRNIGVYEAVNDIFAGEYKIVTFPDSSFVVRI